VQVPFPPEGPTQILTGPLYVEGDLLLPMQIDNGQIVVARPHQRDIVGMELPTMGEWPKRVVMGGDIGAAARRKGAAGNFFRAISSTVGPENRLGISDNRVGTGIDSAEPAGIGTIEVDRPLIPGVPEKSSTLFAAHIAGNIYG